MKSATCYYAYLPAVVTEKQPLLGPNAGESTLVSGEGLNQNNPTEEASWEF